ncbi:MAG: transcription-repair coupling factor (superfamily II helicase), partial [Halothiobacillaceae bacterium]
MANTAQRHPGPLIIITADTPSATQLEYELRFFLGDERETPLLPFPDWETLPYDLFSPHQDIISQRLTTLYRLPQLQRGIVIAPVATLMHRIAPCHYLQGSSFLLDAGQKLNLEETRRRLEAAGYQYVSQVMEHGEFTVRGSLLDLFPMGSPHPYRIDLFDDEVESIRTFDPESQRSIEKIKRIELLPAREFPLTKEAITRFRQRYRETFTGDPNTANVYRDISNGLASAGIEYYLPLFFEETATLFDYLPPSSLVVCMAAIGEAADQFWHESSERYEQRRHDIRRPLLPPARLFLQNNELFQAINHFPRIDLVEGEATSQAAHIHYTTTLPPELPIQTRTPHPLGALLAFLMEHPASRLLFAAESTGRRETLLELLADEELRPTPYSSWREFLADDQPLGITVAPLDRGLLLASPAITVITEPQLFGEQALQRRRRKTSRRGSGDVHAIVRDLSELQPGSPVVHEEHGVGRYVGLQTLAVGGVETEFLTLEYAGGDKLYVPVSSLQLISRYTGASSDNAPLHKLGTDHWQKAREKAAKKAYDVAAELLEIYARREARQGHAFASPDAQYKAFAATFPFEETPDQEKAIKEVIADMTSRRPMDRLICGDVGFGKTEVALRAAFMATQGGYQVAVLVPTTLLAQQHYQNFQDRFADWPIRVEVLSRFRSKKEQDQVIDGITKGTVDIVIGTHKLLQEDVKFRQLGLVIIDEEHRFGVRQKERMKALRADVDILTLSATPIPRTLNMAVSTLRDLSIIATPPSRRLAIKTFVQEWSDATIQEACLREIKRGGQVYFLHNDIDTIDKIARTLEALIPEATVRIGHGQMSERDLERVMLDFYHHRFNILVCTTIIETGIDIPTANTIIINRADRFGLAQLYQLRGRVGRSHHRAYAYLLVPHKKSITKDAEKRLDAIASLEELGAGFTLAVHDLEIRGAGELLGEEQSGQIQEIGFSMYMEMLDRAVKSLKRGEQPVFDPSLANTTEIDLNITALIPGDYLPDVHSRLVLYKRIANAETADDLRELQVEMIDRFGLLPDPIKN